MFEIIPNWHPIFVHFTIALLVMALVFRLAAALPQASERAEGLAHASGWCLVAGLAFAIATVATGLLAYGSVTHDAPSHAAMTNHRNWALVTFGGFVLIGAWAGFARHRGIQLGVPLTLAMIIGVGLLSTTAFKGGELVYRHGLGVISLPEVSVADDGHDHDHGDGGRDDVATADGAPDDGHERADEDATIGSADDGHDHEHADAGPATASSGHSHGVDEILTGDDPAAVADLLNHAIQDGDEAAVLAVLADEVLIFETGGAERSSEEYRGHHMPSDMVFLAAMEIERLERRSGGTGDSAWVSTRSRFVGSFGDADYDLFSTETLMLERRDGRWQVTHIHWSSRPAGEGH